MPIVNNYSNKEISINGYICEEIQKNERNCVYTIQTDEVNGKKEKIKIQLSCYNELNIEEFRYIEGSLYTYKTNNAYSKSKMIFLHAYENEQTEIETTGNVKFSPYYYAIKIRKSMKTSLDSLLPENYSSLSKAILLGDKKSLPYDIKNYFVQTGTTFQIVVSGMHLAIICKFLLFLLKKINSRIITCILISSIVFLFMAITGFTPSVIRAGIMVIITYCGTTIFRRSDSITSLGISALALTIFNPYSVGDVGMILSFAATLGIILWSTPIKEYLLSKFKLKRKYSKYIAEIFSVSLSASLWVAPLSIIFFGTISPFVVVVTCLTELLISIILICALIASLIYMIPFVSIFSYPFALVIGLVSKVLLIIMSFFASIPYSLVNADEVYFYVWIIVTIILVVIGYIIHAKGFYIKCSIAFSLVTLIMGWAIFTVLGYNTTTINIYNCGYGVTVTVESGNEISLLSCGGNPKNEYDIINDISSNYIAIDNIIIPEQKNKYNKYISKILSEFDVSNILVYDKNSEKQDILEEYDGYVRNTFTDNTSFKIHINPTTINDIINIDGVTYQYINSNDYTMLFVPSGGDIQKLPENYTIADVVLIDILPDNHQLLNCDTLVYSGTEPYYKENYNSIKEITDNVLTTFNEETKITLIGGKNG